MKAGILKKSGIYALGFALMASILLMPAYSPSAPQEQARNRVENPAGLENLPLVLCNSHVLKILLERSLIMKFTELGAALS